MGARGAGDLSLRVALYWAPGLDDRLRLAGDRWLGRDAETGAFVSQPDLAGIAAFTAAPRVYGFHATLRAPMRLATSYAAFRDTAARIAGGCAPFMLPALKVAPISGFLALVLQAPCPALHDLADRCVLNTEPHRLAASPAELARRRAAGLSAEETVMLDRFGYPYVMRCWQFHMTLSCRLADADMRRILPLAEAHFASVLGARWVAEICLFTQRISAEEEGLPWLIAERLTLGG